MSKKEEHETIIVGGGPAGLLCAQKLVSNGRDVLVLEADKKIGEPVSCAGLFNKEGLKRLDINSGDYIQNNIVGAKFFAATGESAEISGEDTKAYVVDRAAFDSHLAEGLGDRLMTGCKATSAKKTKEGYHIKCDGEKFLSENVVIATGTDYSIQKNLGFSEISEHIYCAQYDIDGFIHDQDMVELYFGSVAPGFFAWIIPTGKESARIGLGATGAGHNLPSLMQSFLRRLKSEKRFLEKNKITKKGGGPIPLFEKGFEISKDGAYLLGDCAGQVKATTGGGVMLGGLCAQALANSIVDKGSYEDNISDIISELETHLFVRRLAGRFEDKEYEHMIEFMRREDIRAIIEREGDMDFIGPLIKGAMKDPILMMKAAGFFGKKLF